MYKLIFVVFGVLMFAIGTQAFALGNAQSGSASQAGAIAGSQAGAIGMIDESRSNYVTQATDGRDWAPPVSAPSLTTGVCMGSVSGGGSGAGFGISFGTTVVDKQCQIRYNSIRLEQIGQYEASTVILCQVLSMRIALKQSGYKCPTVKNDDDVGVADSVGVLPPTKFESKSVIGGGTYSH